MTRLAKAGRWLLPLLVTTSLVACTGDTGQRAGVTTAPASTPPVVAAPVAGFADLVEKVSPSVVTVRTSEGLGSGVVLRDDVVVTNEHVVGNARDVTLVFASGAQSPGQVLATDRISDVAVVRSDRKNLPVPAFRQDLPRQGEAAVAIGSPLGFENSVTAYVISGLHRDIPGSAAQSRSLVDLIQTDASISPGNSGGALLDAQGRVVGLNEAYIPPTTGAVDLGFAIPAATVLDVANQLLANGTAVHPYLGVSVGRLTPEIQRQLGVDADAGALVLGVDQGGPADQAGIRAGDVIVALGSTKVASVEDLLGALRETKPGQKVTVSVVRGEQRTQLEPTIGQQGG